MMIVFPVESSVRSNISQQRTWSNQQHGLRFDCFRRSWWLHILHRHEESSASTKIDRDEQVSLQIWFKAVGNSQPFRDSYWTRSVQNLQLIELATCRVL